MLAVALSGCGGSAEPTAEEDTVEAGQDVSVPTFEYPQSSPVEAISSYDDALHRRDCEVFIALTTERFRSENAPDCDGFELLAAEHSGSFGAFDATYSGPNDTHATSDVVLTITGALAGELTFELILEDDKWRIDSIAREQSWVIEASADFESPEGYQYRVTWNQEIAEEPEWVLQGSAPGSGTWVAQAQSSMTVMPLAAGRDIPIDTLIGIRAIEVGTPDNCGAPDRNGDGSKDCLAGLGTFLFLQDRVGGVTILVPSGQSLVESQTWEWITATTEDLKDDVFDSVFLQEPTVCLQAGELVLEQALSQDTYRMGNDAPCVRAEVDFTPPSW